MLPGHQPPRAAPTPDGWDEPLALPRIFPPFFDGRWGGEDTALGVVAWEAGCSIVMLDPLRSHVDHEPHRSRAAKENLDLVPDFIRSVRACAFWSTFVGQEAP